MRNRNMNHFSQNWEVERAVVCSSQTVHVYVNDLFVVLLRMCCWITLCCFCLLSSYTLVDGYIWTEDDTFSQSIHYKHACICLLVRGSWLRQPVWPVCCIPWVCCRWVGLTVDCQKNPTLTNDSYVGCQKIQQLAVQLYDWRVPVSSCINPHHVWQIAWPIFFSLLRMSMLFIWMLDTALVVPASSCSLIL